MIASSYLWDAATGLGVPSALSDGRGVVLLILASWAVAAAIDWFAARPGRWRWLAMTLVATLALLAVRSHSFLLIGAIAVAAAVTVANNRRVTVAATVAAAITATLLAMPWIAPGFSILPEELPPDLQYATRWPLTLGAVVMLVFLRQWFASRRAAVTAVAIAGIAMFVWYLAPRERCVVQDGRAFDTTAQSFGCLSSRAAALFDRARAEKSWDTEHPAFDVAGIQTIDGAANGDVLPPFRLAPSFYVPPPGPVEAVPIERDRVVVDHVPAKMAGRGAPRSAEGGAGELVVVEHRPGLAQLRIRSAQWNVLVSTEPAWTGWRAYWNGERLPPVVVNQAFVGSFVPPGDGTLVLRYRPDTFDDGLRVAVAGLLLLIVTLWKPWYRPLAELRFRPRMPAVPRFERAAPLLLAAFFVLLAANFSPIAGGADESGYLNQSRMWMRGQLVAPITLPQQLGLPPEFDPMFIPLGFVHGPRPYTMVPSYPPGLPLMIAPLRPLLGDAASGIVAVLAVAGIWLLYVLGRDWGLSRGWAAAGALMLAVFPTYVFFAVQPMTDSIATALAIAAMICALRSDRGLKWAVLAGVLTGIGVLVRPTQVLLFPAILVALRFRPRALVALGLGGLPFAIVQAAISQHLYGSPFSTGYGGIGYLLSLDLFPVRFRHYTYWLAILGTPLVFPGGLAVWFTRSEDAWRRLVLAAWFLPFFLFYCFYWPYETWWYTRFLMPAFPALLIGTLLLLRRGATAGRVLAAAIIVTGLIHTVRFDLLSFDDHATIYTGAVGVAERLVPAEAVLVTMQMSGAVRYYSERPIVRWDGLDPDKFRIVRQATGARPWYALLAQFEIADAMRNMPGDWVEVARHRDVILFRLR